MVCVLCSENLQDDRNARPVLSSGISCTLAVSKTSVAPKLAKLYRTLIENAFEAAVDAVETKAGDDSLQIVISWTAQRPAKRHQLSNK